MSKETESEETVPKETVPEGLHGKVRATSSRVTVTSIPAEAATPDATLLEFPEPPRRKRRRILLIITGSVALVIGGLLAYLVFSPALAVRSVTVEGASLVTTGEVSAALEPLMGVSLTKITDDQARELLKHMAPIEDVKVAAAPPSTLVLTVIERKPVAVLQSGDVFMLIDAQGRQLKGVKDRASVKLPLIDGGSDAVNSEVFSSITAVLADLPPGILARLESASAQSVDSIELALTGDQKIFWGSAEQNDAKARVLQALLAQPPADPPVREFDVSTPDRPVTR